MIEFFFFFSHSLIIFAFAPHHDAFCAQLEIVAMLTNILQFQKLISELHQGDPKAPS